MHEADLTIVLLHQRPVSLLIKVHAERTLEVAEFHNGNGGVLGTNIGVIIHAHINSALIRLYLPLHAGHALNPGHPASQSKTAIECIAEGHPRFSLIAPWQDAKKGVGLHQKRSHGRLRNSFSTS